MDAACLRRLWHPVTEALKEGDVDTATKHKHLLEERQRSEERQRTASNTSWKPTYFIKEVWHCLLSLSNILFPWLRLHF